MSFRRIVQISSLTLFLFLLIAAAYSAAYFLPADAFLRLDPLIMGGAFFAARTFSTAFIPVILLLVISVVLGRVFCGYICPMGTTLDASDYLIGAPKGNSQNLPNLRPIKYYLAIFLFGAAILGVSLIFIASPLALITRLFGLIFLPVLELFSEEALLLVQPLADKLDWQALVFTQLKTTRFATQFFIMISFILLFASALFSPRFWCRYLCPSGAVMALFSKKPFIGRRVSEECDDCGLCQKACPMAAIPDNPIVTRHEECIVCRTCEDICPVDAIGFSRKKRETGFEQPGFSADRRRFVVSGLAGVGTAAVLLTGLTSVYGKPAEGLVAPPWLLRPPGALPEKDFLAECARCGECMTACPTNALQPIWFRAGIMGLFSPAFTPRRGPCDPECVRCGEVCPTDAIRDLPNHERIWAKIGTAVIVRQECLAWEHQKKCLVCDEVCPFDAVELRSEPGNPVGVPHVLENKCPGCGFCEYHCPVQNRSAILIKPMGELRLADGSYKEKAKKQGLELAFERKVLRESAYPDYDAEKGPAPGFTD